MEKVCAEGNVVFRIIVWLSATGSSFRFNAFLVTFFMLVCHFEKEASKEGVNDGADEDNRCYDVETVLCKCSIFKGCSEVGFSFWGKLFFVGIEREWEFGVLVFINTIFLFGEGWLI